MKKTILTILASLFLFGFSYSGAQELKNIMIQTGEAFNKIQSAIISNHDLGVGTLNLCRELTALFRDAKMQIPNLDHITNDPAKRKELLMQYQEIMNQTIAHSESLEMVVYQQKEPEALTQIRKLKETRKQAHGIFTPTF